MALKHVGFSMIEARIMFGAPKQQQINTIIEMISKDPDNIDTFRNKFHFGLTITLGIKIEEQNIINNPAN